MRNILLISIGSQAFVLPEALAWPGVEFTEVHVLTTDQSTAHWNKDKNILREWMEVMDFVKDRWEISISWSIVKSLPIIQSGDDHKLWTEVLYRWAAEKYQPDGNVYYCLSGDRKGTRLNSSDVAVSYAV